jgi:hypothetical protein
VNTAFLSPDGIYRYALGRDISMFGGRDVNFIMLNPSTADAAADDPTIRRCIAFAKAWGFHRLVVTNLFAFRATDPGELLATADPIGPLTDSMIVDFAKAAELVVAAWGVHGIHRGRAAEVLALLGRAGVRLQCLGTTRDGHPRHPLYLRRDAALEAYAPAVGVPS